MFFLSESGGLPVDPLPLLQNTAEGEGGDWVHMWPSWRYRLGQLTQGREGLVVDGGGVEGVREGWKEREDEEG